MSLNFSNVNSALVLLINLVFSIFEIGTLLVCRPRKPLVVNISRFRYCVGHLFHLCLPLSIVAIMPGFFDSIFSVFKRSEHYDNIASGHGYSFNPETNSDPGSEYLVNKQNHTSFDLDLSGNFKGGQSRSPNHNVRPIKDNDVKSIHWNHDLAKFYLKGLHKDDKVFWVKGNIAEGGKLKWIGRIRNVVFVGLKMDTKVNITVEGYSGESLFKCKSKRGRGRGLVLLNQIKSKSEFSSMVSARCQDPTSGSSLPIESTMSQHQTVEQNKFSSPAPTATKSYLTCPQKLEWGKGDRVLYPKRGKDYKATILHRSTAEDGNVEFVIEFDDPVGDSSFKPTSELPFKPGHGKKLTMRQLMANFFIFDDRLSEGRSQSAITYPSRTAADNLEEPGPSLSHLDGPNPNNPVIEDSSSRKRPLNEDADGSMGKRNRCAQTRQNEGVELNPGESKSHKLHLQKEEHKPSTDAARNHALESRKDDSSVMPGKSNFKSSKTKRASRSKSKKSSAQHRGGSENTGFENGHELEYKHQSLQEGQQPKQNRKIEDCTELNGKRVLAFTERRSGEKIGVLGSVRYAWYMGTVPFVDIELDAEYLSLDLPGLAERKKHNGFYEFKAGEFEFDVDETRSPNGNLQNNKHKPHTNTPRSHARQSTELDNRFIGKRVLAFTNYGNGLKIGVRGTIRYVWDTNNVLFVDVEIDAEYLSKDLPGLAERKKPNGFYEFKSGEFEFDELKSPTGHLQYEGYKPSINAPRNNAKHSTDLDKTVALGMSSLHAAEREASSKSKIASNQHQSRSENTGYKSAYGLDNEHQSSQERQHPKQDAKIEDCSLLIGKRVLAFTEHQDGEKIGALGTVRYAWYMDKLLFIDAEIDKEDVLKDPVGFIKRKKSNGFYEFKEGEFDLDELKSSNGHLQSEEQKPVTHAQWGGALHSTEISKLIDQRVLAFTDCGNGVKICVRGTIRYAWDFNNLLSADVEIDEEDLSKGLPGLADRRKPNSFYEFRVEELFPFPLDTPSVQNDETADLKVSTSTHPTATVPVESKSDENETVALEILPVVEYASHLKESQLYETLGYKKGIHGMRNSCYLDSSLFSLFYCTNVFDNYLLEPTEMDDDFVTEVKLYLKNNIVNSLRANKFLSGNVLMPFRKKLSKFNARLMGSFMDAEDFMFILLERALKSPYFFTYNTGMSDYVHQIFTPTPGRNSPVPTVQKLYELSMEYNGELKLHKIPNPALIIQLPRSDGRLVGFSRIIPSLQLDLSNVMEGLPKICLCDQPATIICSMCDEDAIAFCSVCVKDVTTIHNNDIIGHAFTPQTFTMDLTAMICVASSHYTAYVRCGEDLSSPWLYFDSSGPYIDEVDIFTTVRDAQQKVKNRHYYPGSCGRIFTDCHLCIYQPSKA